MVKEKGGLRVGSRDSKACLRETSIWFSASCGAAAVSSKTMKREAITGK